MDSADRKETGGREKIKYLSKLSSDHAGPSFPIERLQHFNKHSAQFNSHMNFSGCDTDDAFYNVPLPLQSMTNIDFSTFSVPPAPPEERSTKQLVQSLLDPPAHAFNKGLLSINWVISAAGMSHFECRRVDERFILTQTSELRLRGRGLGLPGAYHSWLCGHDFMVSATEEGMILTPEFFEKEI